MLKIKQDVDLSILLQYGFEKTDKEYYKRMDDWTLCGCDYLYNIGHARRGQFYYIVISEEERELNIYASKPDGDGCSINMDDIIIRLYKDGLIEE